MPDKRQHRGPHPHDTILFAPDAHPVLRQAAADLSWLFGRGYASVSAVKLVGDRYALNQRQRMAVSQNIVEFSAVSGDSLPFSPARDCRDS